MNKLYVFGDSYSTPGFCVEPHESWWGLVHNEIKHRVPFVDNYSWPGNNIDSIAHIIVSNLDMFDKDDYVIIGIPPIERLTVFDLAARPKMAIKFDANLNKVCQYTVPRHDSLQQLTRHQLGRFEIDIWNRSWSEAQILRQLLLLEYLIKDCVAGVMVVNLAEPFQPLTQWSVLESLQAMALNKPNFIIFDNTYQSVNKDVHKPVDFDTHGWWGHHGPEGNQHWFDVALLPCMKKIGWL